MSDTCGIAFENTRVRMMVVSVTGRHKKSEKAAAYLGGTVVPRVPNIKHDVRSERSTLGSQTIRRLTHRHAYPKCTRTSQGVI